MSAIGCEADVTVSIVVAAARNGVIGRDGAMPWRLSTDLKRFKSITMGKPIIMGRKTFQSIGKALPGRMNIVVTRDSTFNAAGVACHASVESALSFAKTHAMAHNIGEICVVGGGEIYRQTLPYADQVYYTLVESAPQGDTRFPELAAADWEMTHDEAIPAGEKDTVATRYRVYRQKAT